MSFVRRLPSESSRPLPCSERDTHQHAIVGRRTTRSFQAVASVRFSDCGQSREMRRGGWRCASAPKKYATPRAGCKGAEESRSAQGRRCQGRRRWHDQTDGLLSAARSGRCLIRTTGLSRLSELLRVSRHEKMQPLAAQCGTTRQAAVRKKAASDRAIAASPPKADGSRQRGLDRRVLLSLVLGMTVLLLLRLGRFARAGRCLLPFLCCLDGDGSRHHRSVDFGRGEIGPTRSVGKLQPLGGQFFEAHPVD